MELALVGRFAEIPAPFQYILMCFLPTPINCRENGYKLDAKFIKCANNKSNFQLASNKIYFLSLINDCTLQATSKDVILFHKQITNWI